MAKMRWQVALDVLLEYHTHARVADMAGASEASVSGWVHGRHEPQGLRKRKLIAEAEARYPDDLERNLDAKG